MKKLTTTLLLSLIMSMTNTFALEKNPQAAKKEVPKALINIFEKRQSDLDQLAIEHCGYDLAQEELHHGVYPVFYECNDSETVTIDIDYGMYQCNIPCSNHLVDDQEQKDMFEFKLEILNNF